MNLRLCYNTLNNFLWKKTIKLLHSNIDLNKTAIKYIQQKCSARAICEQYTRDTLQYLQLNWTNWSWLAGRSRSESAPATQPISIRLKPAPSMKHHDSPAANWLAIKPYASVQHRPLVPQAVSSCLNRNSALICRFSNLLLVLRLESEQTIFKSAMKCDVDQI